MLYVLYESPKRKKKLFVINCLFQKISCLHIGCKKTKRLQLVKKYFLWQKYNHFPSLHILHNQNMFPLNQNMTSVIVSAILTKWYFLDIQNIAYEKLYQKNNPS